MNPVAEQAYFPANNQKLIVCAGAWDRKLKAIFFFSCTVNSSERQDRVSPVNAAGHATSDSRFE